MYDLATVKPHVRDEDRYGPVEWRIYARGYYYALDMVIEVLQLAVERFTLARRTRRLEARRTRSA